MFHTSDWWLHLPSLNATIFNFQSTKSRAFKLKIGFSWLLNATISHIIESSHLKSQNRSEWSLSFLTIPSESSESDLQRLYTVLKLNQFFKKNSSWSCFSGDFQNLQKNGFFWKKWKFFKTSFLSFSMSFGLVTLIFLLEIQFKASISAHFLWEM